MSTVRFGIYCTDNNGALKWFDFITAALPRDLSADGLKRELLSAADHYASACTSSWCGRRIKLRYGNTEVSGTYIGYGSMDFD